jgi:hypothetical protein
MAGMRGVKPAIIPTTINSTGTGTFSFSAKAEAPSINAIMTSIMV